MNTEQVRKNNDFLKRFKVMKPRLRMPDYIAAQKNEGVEIEPKHTQPKGHGRGPSERAKVASKIRLSKDLKMVTTNRQQKVYALKIADQII
jgi:hypothetical protein